MGEGLQYFLQLFASGITVGCLYALIALGLVLIFKATDILNFAQGEIIMISAFICYALVVRFHFPYWIAFLVTCLVAFIIGILTERILFRPMIGEPVFAVVMVTIGLSIFIRAMVGIIFGHENLLFPSPFSEETINLWGITLSHAQIWTTLSTVLLITLFFIVFKYTRLGLAMRGTANNQVIAPLMGISVKRIFAMILGVSFVTSAVAGFFLINVMVLNISLSLVMVAALPAIVLGGLESIPGAVIGGLAVGVIENMTGGYLDQIIGGGVKDVTPFVVLFLILMIRPYGLFGKEEVERV
ncbi:branched-chain amino acid ABC transporter permease [Thermodesulfobacteriota bacterium]